jgi:hypothetical protein
VKTHVEIKIRLKRRPSGGLHEILCAFVERSEGWEFPKVESEDYQRHHDGETGFVVCLRKRDLEPAAIAIANLDPKHPNSFRVPNIIPRECSSLTLDQYIAIGLAFVNDLRNWFQRSQFCGDVEVVGPIKTLADIIAGEKSRGFFEAWLHTPTPTSHPSDLYQLDRFICHLFRHRGATRIWEIGYYLIQDRAWKPETARWVVSRIETGLELLRVDRSF